MEDSHTYHTFSLFTTKNTTQKKITKNAWVAANKVAYVGISQSE